MRSRKFFIITSVMVLFSAFGMVFVPIYNLISGNQVYHQSDVQQGSLLAFFSLPFFLSFSVMDTAGTRGEWDTPFEKVHYYANMTYVVYFAGLLTYYLIYEFERLISLF